MKVKLNRPGLPSRDDLLEEISVRSATIEDERLRMLVADVYAGLSSSIRHRAMDRISFWLLADAAFAEHLYIPVPRKTPAVEATFVVIPGELLKWSDRRLRTTIAHEVAHVLLTEKGKVPGHGRGAEDELAADDLCESWGFGRAYTKRQIKRMLQSSANTTLRQSSISAIRRR